MVVASEQARRRVVIERGSADDAFAVAERIAEFGGEAERYGLETYRARLGDPSALVLLAWHGDEPIAFKAGYDRYRDGSWYSWMGGVRAEWRGLGVAQRLLEAQEAWVVDRGYRTLYVKTRNRHKRMLAFLARNGYDVVRVEEKSQLPETRILFCKRFPRAD